jgi:putative spermidine/putrescine transport system ATP-binding protein
VEPGKIRAVVYAGAITRYHVELDAGGELAVVRQNSGSEGLHPQGSRVRAGWRPEHVFELEGGTE